jgi:hypothetical protein
VTGSSPTSDTVEPPASGQIAVQILDKNPEETV